MEKDKEFSEMLKEDLEKKSTINEKGEIFLKGVKDEIKVGKVEVDKSIENDKLRIEAAGAYEKIINVLKYYCDLKEEQYPLIATWILGTYAHNKFKTYPYLFLNAMKGSGKTRLLKLIAMLSMDGEVLTSLREAVLFRTTGTLAIDEFESIGRKGNENLRELLNASYKKGSKVKRMRKAISKEGEEQVVEDFEPYRPIAMANIWGMEEVLGDRCITLILEKSNKPEFTKKVENFDEDQDILDIKQVLTNKECRWCYDVVPDNIYIEWNNYISEKYPNNITTYIHNRQLTALTTQHLDLFNKIDASNIEGRYLELALPLFLIANFLTEENLDNMIKIFHEVVIEKKSEEFIESRDVTFIDFIAQHPEDGKLVSVKDLTRQFRDFVQADEAEDKWANSKWVGVALKRLGLRGENIRTSAGRMVKINVPKAQEKIKVFRE